ncbi:hypothetical protein [Sulfitobacter sp. MF3-043]|uniref:hypothetical protein n=1 Tax=Sulfitobacter sediminivivens TaxID=3252902 RepID=UPI0036D8DB32
MTPGTLRAHIRPLPEFLPCTLAMEKAISVGVGFDGAWYRSQKEHWLGWLAEYNGAGAYGRSDQTPRNAQYAYNHFQCAPMLFWLAEALGFETDILETAYDAVIAIDAMGAVQCVALRRVIHWEHIERRLEVWPYGTFDRLRIRLAQYTS